MKVVRSGLTCSKHFGGKNVPRSTSQKKPVIHVPGSRIFKSGTPKLVEMLVYPRMYGTRNKKGRDLLTEDQAGTQAYCHIQKKKKKKMY